MRASESVPGFQAKLREYTNYSVRGIKKICREIGPRPCGTESEKKAQEYMAKNLKDFADTVEIEPFDVHPKAFMGWFWICGILGIVCVILFNVGLPLVSLIITALMLAMIFGEFLIYGQVIDFLFPKKTSHNMIATRKASGETKRHIVLGGHIDSVYEWRYTYTGGKALLFGGLGFAIVGLVVLAVMSVAAVVQGALFEAPEGFARILGFVSIAFVPGFIGMIIFVNYKMPVEGANDNLTGVFTSAAVLKFLADNDIRFEHTDVTVLSTGGEEAGLRGARAFAKKHKGELGKVESMVIATDTMRDYEHLAIYTKDMSGTVRNHPQASALLKKAGELAGVELEYAYLYAGASDAAAVSKEKIPATAFAAMDPGPPRYYHTRLDTADNLVPKTIEKGIEVLLEAVYLFDEKGLQDSY
ncbi:MAG: M20/M25/M40 family metallo-hydrolase [Oscillospiraceae bacterium]|jgi:hypothetical protein|nr:M20/M25/M40 family metallo-hydrolase [Oscillospiraceae bacterium]